MPKFPLFNEISSYYYLITNYFKPEKLLYAPWSACVGHFPVSVQPTPITQSTADPTIHSGGSFRVFLKIRFLPLKPARP